MRACTKIEYLLVFSCTNLTSLLTQGFRCTGKEKFTRGYSFTPVYYPCTKTYHGRKASLQSEPESGSRRPFGLFRFSPPTRRTAGAVVDVAPVRLVKPSTPVKIEHSELGRQRWTVSLDARLKTAAKKGQIKAVERLLAEGADINSMYKPRNGMEEPSPIWVAAEQGHVEVVNFLIDHGADINLEDHLRGFTPLHIAAKNGHLPVVKLLVEKGAELTVNNCGVDWGSREKRLEVAAQMCRGGGETSVIPLDLAAKYNHMDIAAFLADRQGDAEACLFASDVAAARKHDDMAAMLKAKAQEIKLRGRAGIPQGSRPSRGGGGAL